MVFRAPSIAYSYAPSSPVGDASVRAERTPPQPMARVEGDSDEYPALPAAMQVVMPVMGSSRISRVEDIPQDPTMVGIPANWPAAAHKITTAVRARVLPKMDFTQESTMTLGEGTKVGGLVDALCRRGDGWIIEVTDSDATVDLNDMRKILVPGDALTRALMINEQWRLALWQASMEVLQNQDEGKPNYEIMKGMLCTAVNDDKFLSATLQSAQKALKNLNDEYEYGTPGSVTTVKAPLSTYYDATLSDRLFDKSTQRDLLYSIMNGAAMKAHARQHQDHLLALHAGKITSLERNTGARVGGENTPHGWLVLAATGLRKKGAKPSKSTLQDQFIVTPTTSGVGYLGNRTKLNNLDFYNYPQSPCQESTDANPSGAILTLPGFPAEAACDELFDILVDGNAIKVPQKYALLYEDTFNNLTVPYLTSRAGMCLSSGEFANELPMDDMVPREIPGLYNWVQQKSKGKTDSEIDIYPKSGVALVGHILKKIEARARSIYQKRYAEVMG